MYFKAVCLGFVNREKQACGLSDGEVRTKIAHLEVLQHKNVEPKVQEKQSNTAKKRQYDVIDLTRDGHTNTEYLI